MRANSTLSFLCMVWINLAKAQNSRSGSRVETHRRSILSIHMDHRGTIHSRFLSHSHMHVLYIYLKLLIRCSPADYPRTGEEVQRQTRNDRQSMIRLVFFASHERINQHSNNSTNISSISIFHHLQNSDIANSAPVFLDQGALQVLPPEVWP